MFDKCLGTRKGYHGLSYGSLIILAVGSTLCFAMAIATVPVARSHFECHTTTGEAASSYHQSQAYKDYVLKNGKPSHYFAIVLVGPMITLLVGPVYQLSFSSEERRMRWGSCCKVSTWYLCVLLFRILVLATSLSLQWGYFFPVIIHTDHIFSVLPNDQALHPGYNYSRAVNVTTAPVLTFRCENTRADLQSIFGILVFAVHGLSLFLFLVDIIYLVCKVRKESQEFLNDDKFCGGYIFIKVEETIPNAVEMNNIPLGQQQASPSQNPGPKDQLTRKVADPGGSQQNDVELTPPLSAAVGDAPSEEELLYFSDDICSISGFAWRDVGIQLGLTTAELENIDITDGYRMPKQKAHQMLITWKRGEDYPSRAAITAAIEQEKRRANQQRTNEYHGRQEQGQQQASPSRNPGPKDQLARKVAVILDDIKEDYKRREAFLQPFPWRESHLRSLDKIYTEVKMVGKKKERSELTDKACSMCDIFLSHAECENPRVVLLEGDPGMGKTVFCQKLTFDWASGKTDGFLGEVEVLLKLKCRDLKDSDIEKAIVAKFLRPNSPEEVQTAFLDHIRDTRSKVLIVLDGMDELKEGIDLSPLICGDVFPRCRLLLTSRNNEELGQHCDTLFQVIGFTPKHAVDFIVKYFGDDRVRSRALLDRIGLPVGPSSYEQESENGGLLSLIRSPLNTILLCAVFQETEGELPLHTTHLYQKIVSSIVRIRYKKEGEKPPPDPVKEHKKELAALGRLALQGLENDQLDFREDDVQADDPAKNMLEFGFLSKHNSTSIFETRFSYQFLHKKVQEFFAALCLHEQLLSGNLSHCLTYLAQTGQRTTLFPTFKYKQVALFVAGLLSQNEAGRQLLVDLVSSLTRSLSAVDARSSFLYVCAVLRECAECQQQQLQEAVAREFGWESLGLIGEQLDENSAEYRIVCGALKKENCPLEWLYLHHNNIHDGTLLAESLGVNTSLLLLSLYDNPLTAGSASALARVLSAHPTLKWLEWPKEFRGELEGREHRNPGLGIYYW